MRYFIIILIIIGIKSNCQGNCEYYSIINKAYLLGSNDDINNRQYLLKSNMNYLISLSKVWGALKYYSPEISKNKIDMDSVLIYQLQNIDKVLTKQEANQRLGKLISELTSYKIKKSKQVDLNNRLEWINDTTLFSSNLIQKLYGVVDNKTNFNNSFYTYNKGVGNFHFLTEKAYENQTFPDYNYQLLSLFRFWNIINYFYPHIEIIDEDWNQILEYQIERFISCNNKNDYIIAVNNLMVLLQDSHVIYVREFLNKKYFPNFRIKTLFDTVFVSYPDSSQNIFYGDIITHINGENIDQVRSEIKELTGGGNEFVRDYYSDFKLLVSDTDIVQLTTIRKGEKLVVNYKLRTDKGFNKARIKKPPLHCVSDEMSTYVNLSTVKNYPILDSIVGSNLDKDYIIFDLRNGLNCNMFQILKYFNSKPKAFVKYQIADPKHIGSFRMSVIDYTPVKRNRRELYSGKLIIIVDERTLSHHEYFTMALQTYDSCIVFGSNTAGADGNISKVVLPGNLRFSFTGIGIFYPDGTATQRKGVKLDYYYRPTYSQYLQSNDAALNKVFKLIEEREI